MARARFSFVSAIVSRHLIAVVASVAMKNGGLCPSLPSGTVEVKSPNSARPPLEVLDTSLQQPQHDFSSEWDVDDSTDMEETFVAQVLHAMEPQQRRQQQCTLRLEVSTSRVSLEMQRFAGAGNRARHCQHHSRRLCIFPVAGTDHVAEDHRDAAGCWVEDKFLDSTRPVRPTEAVGRCLFDKIATCATSI